eukprot:PhM_4_TR4289/c0_g1_i1/m.93395
MLSIHDKVEYFEAMRVHRDDIRKLHLSSDDHICIIRGGGGNRNNNNGNRRLPLAIPSSARRNGGNGNAGDNNNNNNDNDSNSLNDHHYRHNPVTDHRPGSTVLTTELLNDPLIESFLIVEPHPISLVRLPTTPQVTLTHTQALRYYVGFYTPVVRENIGFVWQGVKDVCTSVMGLFRLRR